MFGNVWNERAAIESTYEGIADIFEYKEYETPSGAARHSEVIKHKNVSCALSQKNGRTTEQGNDRDIIIYDAKLFISPDYIIRAGSKIRVRQNDMDYTFISAGEPFRYPTHQEIMLKRETNA